MAAITLTTYEPGSLSLTEQPERARAEETLSAPPAGPKACLPGSLRLHAKGPDGVTTSSGDPTTPPRGEPATLTTGRR